MDGDAIYEELVKLYRSKAQMVRLPCNPPVILKMLLLAQPYDPRERPTDAFANDSLSDESFLGVAIDEPAPDHPALTAFKRGGHAGEDFSPLEGME